jgi:hypothetical protein
MTKAAPLQQNMLQLQGYAVLGPDELLPARGLANGKLDALHFLF